MRNIFFTTIIIFSLLVSPIAFSAQVASNPPYTLEQSVIASGGGETNSSGGNFSLAGTIGQAAAGGALSGSPFTLTSGFWDFAFSGPVAQGFEGDASTRPTGDGSVLSNDVVQVRRFLNGSNTLNPSVNEFQRADSAPFATRGDGILDTRDVVQTRRYINNSNPKQAAAGPMSPNAARTSDDDESSVKSSDTVFDNKQTAGGRELRVENVTASAGSQVTVNILVNAVGNEAEYGFIINYDAVVLSNPVIGAGTAGESVRSCNTTTTPGEINCSIGGFPINQAGSSDAGIGEIAPGNNQLFITITFQIAANAPPGQTDVTLSKVNASSEAPQIFYPTATNGKITVFGTTAPNASVQGSVITADGQGVSKARVILTNQSGETKQALTNAFGYYRFTELEAGQTYTISVEHKQYKFDSRVITANEYLSDIDFIALE